MGAEGKAYNSTKKTQRLLLLLLSASSFLFHCVRGGRTWAWNSSKGVTRSFCAMGYVGAVAFFSLESLLPVCNAVSRLCGGERKERFGHGRRERGWQRRKERSFGQEARAVARRRDYRRGGWRREAIQARLCMCGTGVALVRWRMEGRDRETIGAGGACNGTIYIAVLVRATLGGNAQRLTLFLRKCCPSLRGPPPWSGPIRAYLLRHVRCRTLQASF